MADRIKGITIEIDGDVTKLDQALKGVNTSVKNAQSNLKDIDRLLKFNPKNTELLAQKQKALNEIIGSSKDKLKELQKAEESLRGNKEHADQWERVKREIIETESKLEHYNKQLASMNTSALDKVANGFEKAGSKIEAVGKKLLPVSATATGALVASGKAWNEIDEGLDTIISKTGASGDAIEEFKGIFSDVFTGEVAPSAVEAGEAIGELNTRFGFTGKQLKDASEDFLKFASITGVDVNTAVIKVSRAMGDAGIKADDYKSVLDQLAVVGQASGISIEDLTEKMTKFGAPMRQLGFSTKETIALFGTWEKAGVNTEIAFSGMKQAIGKWAKSGKDARVEFKKVLDEIKKAPTLTEATTKAIEVFGQKAGPDLADAIHGGRFEFTQMLEAMEKSDGTVSRTFEDMRDPADRFKESLNSLKLVGFELMDTLGTALAPVIQSLSNKLKEFAQWFQNLSPGMKEFIGKMVLITAVSAPLLVTIGKVAQGIKSIVNAVTFFGKGFSKLPAIFSGIASILPKIGTMFSILGGVIVAHPIVAAIVAIGAAIVGLYTQCEWFRNGVNTVFSTLGSVFSTVWGWIQTAFGGIVNFIGGAFSGIGTTLSTVWTTITTTLSTVWTGISETASTIWGGITDFIGGGWQSLSENAGIIWEGITTTVSGFWTGISETASTIWGGITDFISGGWTSLSETASTIWEGVTNTLGGFWTGISETASTIWGGITETVGGFVTSAGETISGVWNTINETTSTIWSGVSETVGTFAGNVWESVKTNASNCFNSVSEWFGKIPGTISDLWGSAVQFLEGIDLSSIGSNIISGLIGGIQSMAGALWDSVTSIASSAWNGFCSFFGIHSPSRLMMKGGKFLGEGLTIGIDKSQKDVEKATEKLNKTVTDNLDYYEKDYSFNSKIGVNTEISQYSSVVNTLNDLIEQFNGLKQSLVITVPIEIDGKEIARSTVKNIDSLQGRRLRRERNI